LLDKFNTNAKLQLEMKQDLERMKRDFYSKAAVERFDEEHIAASNVVKVNGGRDDGPHVNGKEGHIEPDNTAATNPQQMQLIVNRSCLMQQMN